MFSDLLGHPSWNTLSSTPPKGGGGVGVGWSTERTKKRPIIRTLRHANTPLFFPSSLFSIICSVRIHHSNCDILLYQHKCRMIIENMRVQFSMAQKNESVETPYKRLRGKLDGVLTSNNTVFKGCHLLVSHPSDFFSFSVTTPYFFEVRERTFPLIDFLCCTFDVYKITMLWSRCGFGNYFLKLTSQFLQ